MADGLVHAGGARQSLHSRRRSVGTTVLAEKICDAAAEQGYDLERLAGLCRHHNLTTIHPRNNMMIQANEMVQKKFFH